MDRIIEYVQWYSHVPFSAVPFCEADNLVFCALSYWKIPLEKESDQRLSIRECYKRLAGTPVEMMTTDNEPTMAEFVRCAAESERFGHLLMQDYEDVFLPDVPTQFSAITFCLDEKTRYIAFRGTDSTIAGWKEDFMISFTKTQAQQLSLAYLERHILPGHEYYIGGHSKGGNEALYGAALLSREKLKQVKHIYINDGPGVCKEVLDPSVMGHLDDITTMIRPAYCVIGKLFQPVFSDSRIIQSSQKGPMQHSIFSWGIQCGALALTDSFDPQSEAIERVVDRWLENVSMEERKAFTDGIFSAMTKDGAKTLFELTENGPMAFEKLFISLLDADRITKETLKKLPAAAVSRERYHAQRLGSKMKTELDHQPYLLDAAIALVGLLLLLLPSSFFDVAMACVLFMAFVGESIFTLKELKKGQWNIHAERTRITLCLILLTVFLLILVKEQALFILSSALFGFLLLWYAYYTGSKVKQDRKFSTFYWLHLVEGVLALIFALFILIAPQWAIRWYAISVGSLMILDASVHGLIRFLNIQNIK